MAGKRKASVISADVIGSSTLKPAARRKLQAALDNVFKYASAQWKDLSVQQYRGDSLQAVFTTNRAYSLRAGLLLHSGLQKENFRIRISVGIGEISYKGRNIITSDGSAFQASGHYLDTLIKSGDVISIAGIDDEFTAEWQVHSTTLNHIIERWSRQQAEAIYLHLQQYTQLKMARKLKIRQPSVHQRLQAAGWPVIQKILQRFESVVPSI
jgi:hypothetical protein